MGGCLTHQYLHVSNEMLAASVSATSHVAQDSPAWKDTVCVRSVKSDLFFAESSTALIVSRHVCSAAVLERTIPMQSTLPSVP